MFHGREEKQPQGQQLHAIGQLGDASLLSWPSAETWTPRGELWRTKGLPRCDDEEANACGLWRVSLSSVGCVRGLPVTSALTATQLLSGPLPAGNAPISRLPIWARIVVDDNAGARVYLVDWDQTLDVNADTVGVAWVAPPGWANYPNDPFPAIVGEDAIVVEGMAFCDFARLEAPSAQRQDLTLTQTYVYEADTTVAYEVPRGARTLQVSRDIVGATQTGWWQTGVGSIAPQTRVNTGIRFENGQSAITSIAPNITHVRPPTLAGGESALWTLTWTIAI